MHRRIEQHRRFSDSHVSNLQTQADGSTTCVMDLTSLPEQKSELHPAFGHDSSRGIPDLNSFVARYSRDLTWPTLQTSDSKEHRIIQTEGSKYKPCVLCQINKVKTKSGWYVYTYYRCEQCDVPLCKGRGCFIQYHKTIVPANIANQ